MHDNMTLAELEDNFSFFDKEEGFLNNSYWGIEPLTNNLFSFGL